MLTKNNLLVVRNRYKLLPCYDKEKGKPAYKVFRASLVEIFGESATDAITHIFDKGQDRNLSLPIEDEIYEKLRGREDILSG